MGGDTKKKAERGRKSRQPRETLNNRAAKTVSVKRERKNQT